MRASLLLGSLASCALIDPSLAADSAADSSDLDAVVVTATRSEQPLRRIGDSISVIDPSEVREHQNAAVSDLLALTPGVSVTRNGGLGSTTSLSIRGAESQHTLVLIDGIRLNDPSSPGGGYDFADLLTDDVSRIEVLRGPQSTLWGSQAIGGVVNIVTALPQGPLSGAATVEGGSRGTGQARAKLESGDERLAWRLSGGYLTTQGISAFDHDLGGTERDSYHNANFSGRALLKLNDSVSADVRSTYWRSRSEFDGFPAPAYTFADTDEYGKNEELVGYAGLNIASFDQRLKSRIAYAFTSTDRENFDPDLAVTTTFDSHGRSGRWEYQGTVSWAEGYESVFGIESERSELRTASPSEFDPNPTPLERDVTQNSAYAQLQGNVLPSLTLTAGLRYDDHDTFGNQTTGRVAAAWSVLPATLVRASYGEGFKAPTLYQLFSEYGNSTLQPEEADGWDLGIEQHALGDTLMMSATYFDRDTSNMIDFVSCLSSTDPRCVAQPSGFYDNVQQTSASGVELAAAMNVSLRAKLTANFTRTDAENAARGTANYGRELRRRAKNIANADVEYQWPLGLLTSVTVHYVGKSYDDAANLFPLDAYALIDLRARFSVTERLEVYGRIENALDENYETTRQYGSPGRGVFVGARTSF